MSLDKFERFVSNTFCNVGQSFYDSYVEANVSFRSKLGMRAVIIRRQLGNCCKWCADLAGIYDPSDAPDDIYRRHRNCRCLVTYKTQEGYQNVWNKKVFKTQKNARIEKLRRISKNELFASMKIDRSNLDVFPAEGTKHSEEELNEIKIYAREKGIGLVDFQNYDGDVGLVKEFIDDVSKEVYSFKLQRKKRILIRCSYSLDKDTFAITNNSTITINGFAYRDRKTLESEYLKSVNDGWFTQGSTYYDIARHESAHIIVYLNSLKTKDLQNLVFDSWDPFEIDIKASANISKYAGVSNDELIAESYTAYKNGSRNEYVLKTLKLCGILKIER